VTEGTAQSFCRSRVYRAGNNLDSGWVSVAEQKAILPTWARILAVIVGVLLLAAAGLVLLEPVYGLFLMVVFLGIALVFLGMDRIVAGITGHPYSWMTMTPVGPTGPAGGQPGAPRSPS